MRRIAAIAVTILASFLMSAAASASARPTVAALHRVGAAPDSFEVTFVTTKGAFTMKARRAWSPLGVDRLWALVHIGWFDGLAIYRVGPTKSVAGGRVVQFGEANDPALTKEFAKDTIADEPVVRPHRRGTVNFARGGPNSRSIEVAITTNEAAPLDTVQYLGVKGFPSIAEVERGLDVLDKLEGRYGNAPIESDSLETLGRTWLDRAFPGLDAIRTARVNRVWGAAHPAKPHRSKEH